MPAALWSSQPLDLFGALELSYAAFMFAAAIAFAAGLIREFPSFGATMTLALSHNLIMPPTEAVAIALIMEISGASQLLPCAARETNWWEFTPLTLAAYVLAPAAAIFLSRWIPISHAE